jgi:hypothetical protein
MRTSKFTLIFFLNLFWVTPTWGQDTGLENAKQFFDEGQNLYLQGKYTEAAEQFLKAYEVKNYPAFLFNIAVCFEKDRSFIKALEYYERYLKEDALTQDKDLVAQRIAAIREHLNPPAGTTQPTSQPTKAQAQAQAQAVQNLPPVKMKGLVVIESKPEGAAIYLNDKTKGIFTRTPYTGSLPPGKHTVILEMRKFKPERKTVVVRNDRMTYLYFALSAEEYLGWIEVKANVPGADVFFDKKEVGAVGRTPYTGFLRPGKRTIIVERAGYAPYTKEVEITAGRDHVFNVSLEKVDFGWLKITGKTTQGATILVNEKPIACDGYPCRTKLPPGTYRVKLKLKGYKDYAQDVTIIQASETQLAVRLNPAPSRVEAYITFGVSTAFLVGAITVGVMSNNRKNDLQNDLDQGRLFDSSDPRIQNGRILAIVANSLFALTGLTGGLGLYYLFRNVGADSYGESQTTKIAIMPSLSPELTGITGLVRF